MSFKILGCTAFLGFSLICQTGFAAETMVFKNENGSVLELSAGENSTVSGYFTTAVATKECQQAVGQKRPVVGFLTGNALTLSIAYPDCGSALSIIGNLKDDNKAIDTTWVVSHQLASAKNQGLAAQFIGHNIYQRIS
ncbi:avidin/streptavidin family protein [Legionella massiliensis]|nr:avidin/streptavidin family protein [Legionella massiliensis]